MFDRSWILRVFGRRTLRLVCGGIVAFIICLNSAIDPVHAATRPINSNAAMGCTGLARTDFTALPDAPTEIANAKADQTSGDLVREHAVYDQSLNSAYLLSQFGKIDPYCEVSGYVAPGAGFLILLPQTNWNGKLLQVGCGGWCGTTAYVPVLCALHPHYACFGTDMGHSSSGGLWIRGNLQGQIDFSYRATHVATLAAKAITNRYFGKSPSRSYFLGCSTGGYQDLVEAQLFPWDYDGIVAGAPDMDEADLALRSLWIKRHFLRSDGRSLFQAPDLALLHAAALRACDLDDGVADGIISAPFECRFDPAVLRCTGAKSANCLTSTQVAAAKAIYGRPTDSVGKPLSSSGVFPGSELNWATSFVNNWGDEYLKETGMLNEDGQPLTAANFNFDKDYQRLGIGVTYADTDPDLRRFRNEGGKLIIYQGGNDTDQIPGAIFDYYSTVERTMGGSAATGSFFRFFVIPGMNHCSGGDGPFAVDYLSYLEDWVEHGRSPDVLVGAHLANGLAVDARVIKFPIQRPVKITFQRPIYAYPLHAHLRTDGDPNKLEDYYATR